MSDAPAVDEFRKALCKLAVATDKALRAAANSALRPGRDKAHEARGKRLESLRRQVDAARLRCWRGECKCDELEAVLAEAERELASD
jgi:hypothetical protein